jgi:hypothetical protein
MAETHDTDLTADTLVTIRARGLLGTIFYLREDGDWTAEEGQAGAFTMAEGMEIVGQYPTGVISLVTT